ncbi:hypothetical protein CMV_015167 [Castanea mollissima]|uniref:Uncharacterized protein n=1 Tax=Castanea mollissima TaxID=60419 RepID=A0A8J4VKA8_9ROSI|nr:hypothetical protein CMV_015167 [Castanea mollissima]
MKLSTKPISSPGRTEKFPPPLMRFLRTNVGSRSRGRARSSPMFVRNKRNSNAAIETQEPTSPKVTCMGQVRVRRSSNKQPSKGRNRRAGATSRRRRCKWLQNALLCRHVAWNMKPKCCGPVWRKWVLFFQVGFRRKGETRQDSPKSEQKFGNNIEFSEREGGEEEEEEEEEEEQENVEKEVVAKRKQRKRRTEQENNNRDEEHAEHTAKPTSESESISDQESRVAPETEKKLECLKEFEGSIKERFLNSSKIEELKAVDVSVGPLILTRCKSEPARTGEKLDPDSNFWKRRRLGLTGSNSQPVL